MARKPRLILDEGLYRGQKRYRNYVLEERMYDHILDSALKL